MEVGGEHVAPGFDGAIGRNMTREWNVLVGSFIQGTIMYVRTWIVLLVLSCHDITALRSYVL